MTDQSITAKTKYCSTCKTVKSVDEFYRRRSRPCGYASKCKACRNAYHSEYLKTPKGQRSLKESSRKYWIKYGEKYSQDPVKKAARNLAAKKHAQTEKSKTRRRDYHLRTKYGITLAEYTALFTSQHESCAICNYKGEHKNFHLDHDHVTGKVRGILCNPCNGALGLFRDDPDTLKLAIEYLVKHATN